MSIAVLNDFLFNFKVYANTMATGLVKLEKYFELKKD